MIELNKKILFLLLILIWLVGCGSKTQLAKNQSLQSSEVVHIQNSSPLEQLGGTCVFFSTASYLEALRIREVGTKNLVRINPYYLHFAEKLYFFNKLLDSNDPIKSYNAGYAFIERENNSVKDTFSLDTDGTSSTYIMDNLLKIGIVPTDSFALGNFDPYESDAIIKRIKIELDSYFRSGETLYTLKTNRNLLTSALRKAYAIHFPLPNEFFKYGEKYYTPIQFLDSYIKNKSELNIAAYDSKIYGREKIEKLIKLSLYNGIPIITSVFDKTAQVSHAMLMVDYKTETYPLGSIPELELVDSLSEKINGILLKNSWGSATQLTGQKFDWIATEQVNDLENQLKQRYTLIDEIAYERLFKNDNSIVLWIPRHFANNVEILFQFVSQNQVR